MGYVGIGGGGMKKRISVVFPQNLRLNKSGMAFFVHTEKMILRQSNSEIIFDLTQTKNLKANLMGLIDNLIDKAKLNGNRVYLQLPEREELIRHKVLDKIFYMYKSGGGAVFKTKNIYTDSVEISGFLTKDLQKLELKDYHWISIILSEIIANIEMHTETKCGKICGYLDEKEGVVVFTIANFGLTIREQVLEKNLEFTSDDAAILWVLKKTSSTRDSSESGGLGLYLLRKHISRLGGSFSIISGEYIMEFSKNCYYADDEMRIEFESSTKLKKPFKGCLVTVRFPYIKGSVVNREKYDSIEIQYDLGRGL